MSSSECQAISATRTVRDPVSLLVFHGAWSNGCNMEEVEEVIEPTTELECIIDCVAFFYEEGKGWGGGGTTGRKTNLVVGSTEVKSA